jgi:hypothetical protein
MACDPPLPCVLFFFLGPPQGEMLLSVELVPLEIAKKMPAGFGRSAPNANPELPNPTGRLKFVRCVAKTTS